MSDKIEKYIFTINELLNQLETKIAVAEYINLKISNANVGWHIEHSLLAINEYIDTLNKSDPRDYKWKFNFIRIIVLTTKIIPKGIGKSPKDMLPKENINKEMLAKHLSDTRNNINRFKQISLDSFINHPLFGQLQLIDTLNFLETHTKHHIKIIDFILI